MAQNKHQSDVETKSATQTKRLVDQESALQSARRRLAQHETKKNDVVQQNLLDATYDKPRVPPTVGGLHSQIKKLTETIKSQP